MLVADSHEFIELYRGDKDLRMGIEMLRVDPGLRFISFAPDRASPNDRERFGVDRVEDIGLPELPERFDLRLLPSRSIRFARKESGGILSWMPGYQKALAEAAPDAILENPFSWLTPRSYQTHLYARAHRVPVVYYDPGDDIPISAKHRLMASWETPVVRASAAIITYNEAGRRRFVNKYRYPAERIHVIPKPVDVAACRYKGAVERVRLKYGAHEGDTVVGYVGRLAAYKGSAILLEVARRADSDPSLRDIRFVFVGDTLSSTESVQAYEGHNTYVTGMVPHHEIPQHLAACDVVVFPDVTRPGGFPTAVAEAMAAGRPLIVGVGDKTEFLPLLHRHSAMIVPPASADAILQAILDLRANRSFARQLGAEVGRFAEQYMDYPQVAGAYLDILSGVVGGRQKPVVAQSV